MGVQTEVPENSILWANLIIQMKLMISLKAPGPKVSEQNPYPANEKKEFVVRQINLKQQWAWYTLDLYGFISMY